MAKCAARECRGEWRVPNWISKEIDACHFPEVCAQKLRQRVVSVGRPWFPLAAAQCGPPDGYRAPSSESMEKLRQALFAPHFPSLCLVLPNPVPANTLLLCLFYISATSISRHCCVRPSKHLRKSNHRGFCVWWIAAWNISQKLPPFKSNGTGSTIP